MEGDLEEPAKVIPGSKVNEDGQTIYEVVEVLEDPQTTPGYEQIGEQDSSVTDPNTQEPIHMTTITNRELVSLTVQKKWLGVSAQNKKPVTVQLYRMYGEGPGK